MKDKNDQPGSPTPVHMLSTVLFPKGEDVPKSLEEFIIISSWVGWQPENSMILEQTCLWLTLVEFGRLDSCGTAFQNGTI